MCFNRTVLQHTVPECKRPVTSRGIWLHLPGSVVVDHFENLNKFGINFASNPYSPTHLLQGTVGTGVALIPADSAVRS